MTIPVVFRALSSAGLECLPYKRHSGVSGRQPALEMLGSALVSVSQRQWASAQFLAQSWRATVRAPIDPPRGSRISWYMRYRDRITIEAGKRGGKPCIRGLRITVYDILEYLASGMSHADILRDFPDLEAEDIRACLEFAADRERRMVSVPPE